MAERIAFSIVGKVGEYLVAPIGRQFRYLFCYNSNIQNLRDQLQDLENARVGVQILVDEARRDVQVIGPDVVDWLKKVSDITTEAEVVFADTAKVQKGCLNGWCPNVKSRYVLGRKATKKSEEAVKHQDKSKFSRVSYPAPPAGVASTSTEGSKGFESKTAAMKDIIAAPATSVGTSTSTEASKALESKSETTKDIITASAPPASTSTGGYKGFESKTAATKDIIAAPATSVGVASTSTEVSKGFESRMLIMQKIIEALKDDELSMIGICGLGGVGKTTMVKEVAAKAKVENLFHEVAITTVSQNKDLVKIQDDLAGMLGLNIKETISFPARVEQLRQRLSNGNKILVILDDVWDELDLEEVGISVKGGCKVVLTTRNERVCSDMGSLKNFTVEVLFEPEAWALFREVAGNFVDTIDIHPIAKEVVKECGGLPIAIVTVAKALKNRKKHAWSDALQQLRKSTVTNIPRMLKHVYSSIELSFNFLENVQTQTLLMLCSLFPEDFKISTEFLVRYWMGLSSFQDVENLVETRNRVYTLADELKSCFLLQAVDEGHVKMHDVIRDVCIWIASKEGYMARHDTKLREWPQNDKYQPYKGISVLLSNQMRELPAGLDCPRLELLQVIGTINSPEIPMDFFHGMRELRVVAFMNMSVETPPPSLQFLMNLRTLCLYRCLLGPDISVIGSLKNLEILSFFDSDLIALPSEFAQLSNLKMLDLRCAWGPQILPPGVLSNLYGLEELYIRNDYWAEGGHVGRPSITELNSLCHLNALEICIPDAELLPKEICVEKLMRFNITMGGGHRRELDRYELCEFLNSLRFHGDVTTLLETKIKSLVRRTEKLCLTSKGLRNVVKELDEEGGFVKLKNLEMVDCEEVKYLIDAMGPVPGNPFINLESLTIRKLGNLKEICHGNLPMESFGQLQEVTFYELPVMKHLWSGPIQPPCLSNLRFLSLYACDQIESLFPRSVVRYLRLKKINYLGTIGF